MTDFDMTLVPEQAQQRLEQTAAEAQAQGQAMFTRALAEQSALLRELGGPAGALMTATAANMPELSRGPQRPRPGLRRGAGLERGKEG